MLQSLNQHLMAEHHLVADPEHLPPPVEWIAENLGITEINPKAVDVLYYERFRDELSGVILLPKAVKDKLPTPNRTILRTPAPAREPGAANRPPLRVRRAGIARGERTIGIEEIDCPEVSLRISTSRVSTVGLHFDILTRTDDMDVSWASFERWLQFNGLPDRDLPKEAGVMLYAAYAVALTARLDKSHQVQAPSIPLLHNQRSGLRYRLYFGREKQGSPSDLHILLYTGDNRPAIYGVPANPHSIAGEHKEGLDLLHTLDRRIRFYQLTDDQWAEWNKTRPDISTFPPQLRDLVAAAFAAAESLRARNTTAQARPA